MSSSISDETEVSELKFEEMKISELKDEDTEVSELKFEEMKISESKDEDTNNISLPSIINWSDREKEYYNNHVDKIIKIQSLIKRRYWFLDYTKKIKTNIDKLYQRENKKFAYEPTLFGDNSKENIKMFEIAFRQKQKQMKEGRHRSKSNRQLAWLGRFMCWSLQWIRLS